MSNSEILLYRASDGEPIIQVRLEDESVWLTQEQMAALFQKSKSTVNEHIQNIFQEGELQEMEVMRKFGISEFSTNSPYNWRKEKLSHVAKNLRIYHKVTG